MSVHTTHPAPRVRTRRPSVIVDMAVEHPRFTSPLTIREIHAMADAPIPHAVFVGMYTAAWARAEGCPLNILSGRLEPHCRHNPSDALWSAVAQGMGNIVGVLGFGIPVLRDERQAARAATWPATFGWSGATGRS